jgi:ParB family chromosome partitioning protein
LIPDDTFEDEAAVLDRPGVRLVPLDEIRPNPEQPRTVFSAEALADLAASIRTYGVLMPLVVRRFEGHYVLIAGERRLRAAGLAGLREVPCLVREASSSREQLELALVENLQREDLDVIEAARGYERLIEEFGLTQDEVAGRVGKNRATVANAVRLLALPDHALAALRDGRISAGHARAVLPLLETPGVLREVLAQCVAKGWSVREVEREVARRVAPRPASKGREREVRNVEYATRLLRDALKTSVAIKPLKGGGGRIVVDYADAEDLERLLAFMRHQPGAKA